MRIQRRAGSGREPAREVAASNIPNITIAAKRIARNAVAGPWVAGYGPLAAGHISSNNVQNVVTMTSAIANLRAAIHGVCHLVSDGNRGTSYLPITKVWKQFPAQV